MKTVLLVLPIICVCYSSTLASINWDIYSNETIDSGIYSNVNIFDSPPNHTYVTVLGGDFHFLTAYDSSVLTISGGNVSVLTARETSTVMLHKAQISVLDATQNSIVNIYGQDLTVENSILTGLWADGTPFSMTLRRYDFQWPNIHLIEIPEPASAFILVIGGLLLHRRHHK